jgi:large subunit ribosomal protein L3
MSHGNSLSHRAPGSIGHRQTPGRVFPGKRMAGRLGADKVTTINLEVIKIDAERNLLLVKGAVAGSENGQVVVRAAVKAAKAAPAAKAAAAK